MSAKKKLKTNNTYNLRSELFEGISLSKIHNAWNRHSAQDEKCTVNIAECGVKIIQHPFPVCLISDLAPLELIREVVQEIPSLKFHEKSNDLYQFHQTTDVANFLSYNAVSELYNLISRDVLSWTQKTLVPSGLKDNISATFSCYAQGDRLLCHDDKCEDRHIAFVLYLTEGWAESDGGNLELFETDDRGDPIEAIVSIPAQFNTLVLFEVTPTSYHQVTEILSVNKKRLSLNGWFHKEITDEWPEASLRIIETYPASDSDITISEFVFDKYLKFKNQLDIKRLFVSNSEIQLEDFFLPHLLNDIESEFQNPEIVWEKTGPANVRHYEAADVSSLPPTLSSIYTLLQSKLWLSFLRNITGLDLAPHTKSDFVIWEKGVVPLCRVEMQRWRPGTYTLVHDRDVEFHISALDIFIRFPIGGELPDDDDGPETGHIIYIDKQSQDEECLLHLGYKKNSLGMVFREPETLRFTKYLDAGAPSFYQIQCLYIPWSAPEDQPELKHVEDDSDESGDVIADEDDDEEVDDVELCDAELLEDLRDYEDEGRSEDNKPSTNGTSDS